MPPIPFPLRYRETVVYDAAFGYVERAEIPSKAMEFLSAIINGEAQQLLQQGIAKDAAIEEIDDFFTVVYEKTAALGCPLPGHLRIEIYCLGVAIDMRADDWDLAG